MSRFVSLSDTKELRAPWWDEDEVVVIRRMGYGRKQRIQAASTKAVEKGELIGEGSQRYRVVVDMAEMHVQMMVEGIMRWTLKDAEGEVVPLTRGSIERLWERDGEFIQQAIDTFNKRVGSEVSIWRR